MNNKINYNPEHDFRKLVYGEYSESSINNDDSKEPPHDSGAIKIIGFMVAMSLKLFLIYWLVSIAVNRLHVNIPFYGQHISVWLLIYFPLFAGYESLLSVLLSKFRKK